MRGGGEKRGGRAGVKRMNEEGMLKGYVRGFCRGALEVC